MWHNGRRQGEHQSHTFTNQTVNLAHSSHFGVHFFIIYRSIYRPQENLSTVEQVRRIAIKFERSRIQFIKDAFTTVTVVVSSKNSGGGSAPPFTTGLNEDSKFQDTIPINLVSRNENRAIAQDENFLKVQHLDRRGGQGLRGRGGKGRKNTLNFAFCSKLGVLTFFSEKKKFPGLFQDPYCSNRYFLVGSSFQCLSRKRNLSLDFTDFPGFPRKVDWFKCFTGFPRPVQTLNYFKFAKTPPSSFMFLCSPVSSETSNAAEHCENVWEQ